MKLFILQIHRKLFYGIKQMECVAVYVICRHLKVYEILGLVVLLVPQTILSQCALLLLSIKNKAFSIKRIIAMILKECKLPIYKSRFNAIYINQKAVLANYLISKCSTVTKHKSTVCSFVCVNPMGTLDSPPLFYLIEMTLQDEIPRIGCGVVVSTKK